MLTLVLLAWLAVFVTHAVFVCADVAAESRKRGRGA